MSLFTPGSPPVLRGKVLGDDIPLGGQVGLAVGTGVHLSVKTHVSRFNLKWYTAVDLGWFHSEMLLECEDTQRAGFMTGDETIT